MDALGQNGKGRDDGGLAMRPANGWSRRIFLRRAVVAGASMTTLGGVLAACVGAEDPVAADATAGTATEADAAFDAMRYAGSTVRVVLVDGERDELGLRDKTDQIMEDMGIEVELSTMALGALEESLAQNLRAPESQFDIVHVLGFSVSSHVGAGLLEPLTPYLTDPARTPQDFDLQDFPEGQLEYIGYYDVESGQFGGDDLYLIPGIHSGTVILYYRADLLEEAGIQVPTTWEEYLSAAEALHSEDTAGNAMIGANDVSLFLVDWYSRFAGMGGELMSGSPDGGDFMPNLTSEPAVRALQHMIDCAEFAPDAVASYGFTEALDAFATGNVALMLSWATIGGALFDEAESRVADTVAVDLVPADEGLTPSTVRGGWGLGIPENLPQEQKDAAWHLMTYLASREFELYQVSNYKTDPNRLSVFNDDELVEQLPYLPISGQAAENASILRTASVPENFELIGEAAREFNLAMVGDQDAETACQNAQDAWIQILQRAGHLT